MPCDDTRACNLPRSIVQGTGVKKALQNLAGQAGPRRIAGRLDQANKVTERPPVFIGKPTCVSYEPAREGRSPKQTTVVK